ncbi:MAG: cyclodeaminase/cyclohydrolase family protein [Candidatus Bipolaricaulaceae bacterium]
MNQVRLLQMQVEDLLGALSSPAPTPGGGTAAALCGAQAAALAEMVAAVSARRGPADQLNALAASAGRLRASLAAGADADAAAYAGVVEALRLPRGEADQRRARDQARQQALRRAAEVPLGTAQSAGEVLELCHRLLPLASPRLYSDLAAAVRLAQAAAHAALYNVDANAASIADEESVRSLRHRREQLAAGVDRSAGQLLSELEGSLAAWLGERDSNPH